MPKVGQEPKRRAALVGATIAEIGRAGSLDVTVGQIARRAGMSTALAHYYFDSKDAIFLAAMRHLLTEFRAHVRAAIAQEETAAGRLYAIVEASLGPDQFADNIVASWLVFYVQAQHSQDVARLLRVYARRLHSNLMHELSSLMPRDRADRVAKGTAAMIDGIYIRHALNRGHSAEATELVKDYLALQLAAGKEQ